VSTSSDRPLFIVLEGIDGSGSTTQGDRIAGWLRNLGRRAFFTHEPSSGPAGMLIRLALSRRLRGHGGSYHIDQATSPPPSDLDPYTLALLYAADRTDHLAVEILPNLRSGRVVVCDRYLMSTLAYQGLSVDEDWLLAINRHAPPPDLCIYLDLSIEHARSRMQRTRWTRDLYEEDDKLRIIRERYLRIIAEARPELGPVAVVDASASMNTVTKRIQSLIQPLFSSDQPAPAAATLSLFSWPE